MDELLVFLLALLTGAFKHGLHLTQMLRITGKVSIEPKVIACFRPLKVVVVILVYVVKCIGYPHTSESYGVRFSCNCIGFASAGRYVEEEWTVAC